MYSLLLIDDEPMIKVGIRKLLKDSNYVVTGTASNGMEALSLLEMNPADIILTDLKMPTMDGIELIRHLKADGFEGVILALSNYSDFDLVRKALTEGAADYLLKTDITRAHLLEHLDKVTEELKSQKEHAKRNAQYLLDRQKLLAAEWQAYLTSSGELSKEAEQLLFSHGDQRSGIDVILISLKSMQIPKERQKRVISQIKEILPDIFGISGSVLTLKTDRAELCCLIPKVVCVQETERLMRLIQRRTSLYLDVTPVIAYAENKKGVESIREAYVACRHAEKRQFYEPERTLYNADLISDSAEAYSTPFRGFVKKIQEVSVNRDKSMFTQTMQDFFETCRRFRPKPEQVLNTCCYAVEGLAFSEGDTKEARLVQAALLEKIAASVQLEQLMEIMMGSLADAVFLSDTGVRAAGVKKEIKDALSYLEAHYTEAISLEDVAEYVNLNKSYLCRIFKQQMEVSVFSYINRLRMEKGARYIRENRGNCTIGDTAYAVGIEDPFYFTRKFKAYWGKSPSEYAKEIMGEEKE